MSNAVNVNQPSTGTGTGNAVTPGPENRNKNLKNLNVNGGSNKTNFVTAFKSAAVVANGAGFGDIEKRCGVLAATLESNNKIDLSTAFGNYGNNKEASNQTAANNLNKVKKFTNSQVAPTRAVILIKILSEIKDLVKNKRNRINKLDSNIKTVKNFNMAIIGLINAVNKAKAEVNNPSTNKPNVVQNANPAKNALNAYNKSSKNNTAVKAYASAINAYASGVNVSKNNISAAKTAYNNAISKPNATDGNKSAAANAYAKAITAYAIAVNNAKKSAKGNGPAAQ